jgi:hypothetical protein
MPKKMAKSISFFKDERIGISIVKIQRRYPIREGCVWGEKSAKKPLGDQRLLMLLTEKFQCTCIRVIIAGKVAQIDIYIGVMAAVIDIYRR